MFFICIFILEIHIVRERYKERFKSTLIKQSGSVMFKKKKRKNQERLGKVEVGLYLEEYTTGPQYFIGAGQPTPKEVKLPVIKGNRQFFTLTPESSISLYPLC